MSYLDIGFNENLSINDSSNQPDQINPLEFQQFTQDVPGNKINSSIGGQYVGPGVNAANITLGQMALDRLKSGTLTLGGVGNVNGSLVANNELDQQLVSIDDTGLNINSGGLTVKNRDNKTIVDATGIVGTNAFNTGSITGAGNNTSSTTYVDVTGATINFNLTRQAKVLVAFSAWLNVDTSPNYMYLGLNVDGSDPGNLFAPNNAVIEFGAGLDVSTTISQTTLLTLNAGAHTLKLRVKNGGAGTVAAFLGTIIYIVLGT